MTHHLYFLSPGRKPRLLLSHECIEQIGNMTEYHLSQRPYLKTDHTGGGKTGELFYTTARNVKTGSDVFYVVITDGIKAKL